MIGAPPADGGKRGKETESKSPLLARSDVMMKKGKKESHMHVSQDELKATSRRCSVCRRSAVRRAGSRAPRRNSAAGAGTYATARRSVSRRIGGRIRCCASG
nr:hypothetical protein CFP56_43752 [Quercus suber]